MNLKAISLAVKLFFDGRFFGDSRKGELEKDNIRSYPLQETFEKFKYKLLLFKHRQAK